MSALALGAEAPWRPVDRDQVIAMLRADPLANFKVHGERYSEHT